MTDQEEIWFEQGFVDWVFEEIEREKEKLRELIAGAVANGAPKAVFKQFEGRLEQLERVPDKVLHGRLDMESEETFYIGRLSLDSDGRAPLVNYEAEFAAVFYQASRAEPLGVGRRRTIRMQGRRVVGIEDELLIPDFKVPGITPDVPPPPPGVTTVIEPVSEPEPGPTAPTGGVERGRTPTGPGPGGGAGAGPGEVPAPASDDGDEPGVRAPDSLLDELGRTRTGTMGEIVATIQADQDRLIRADPGRVLIVQGGPGTGKTIVALHRVAWVMYRARELGKPPTALVVGPNDRFVDYIGNVLPELGEGGAVQSSLAAVARSRLSAADRERTRPTRIEDPRVAELKGSARMAEVVRRSTWRHVRPEAVSVAWRRYRVELSESEVRQQIDELFLRNGPYRDLRQDLVEVIARRLGEQLAARVGAVAVDLRDLADVVRRHLRGSGAVTRMVPAVSARQAIRRLFTDAEHMAECTIELATADRNLLAAELVANGRYRWSEHDGPLLDEAAAVIDGPPGRFTHVVVDEAQDLSPMQWRMVTRRSAGLGMTITGDLAQATSEWGAEDWDEVARRAGVEGHALYAELKLGYRVPEPTMQYAGRLLPAAAPMVDLPRSFRPGEDPEVHRTTARRLVDEVVSRAAARVDGSVAVIVPPDLQESVSTALDDAGVAVAVVVDDAVKGLEFDHTIVVAPDRIARGGAVGLRRLYICLTRATKHLVVLHTRELPEPLRGQSAPDDIRAEIRRTKLAKFTELMAPRQAQLRVYAKAYAKWTDQEDDELSRRLSEGFTIEEIAELHRRSPGSIRRRAKRLEESDRRA